jgi:periplasmic divalent cation tolerance protein
MANEPDSPASEAAPLHLLLSTFPDEPTARRVVLTLVEERIVACGNIIPGLTNIYRWQGTIETSAEVLVVFKTAISPEVAITHLKDLHPYEVPEIIVLPVTAVLPAYLAWVQENSRA